MTYCGKCGAENPDGNGFCYRCGARLEGSPYRSASDVREIKVERPEPPKATRLEEVPDNGSPYRSFRDVRTRTAAGTNAEVLGEEKTDTVTDYTKVDLPGVRRKAPRSNDHTSVLAVVIAWSRVYLGVHWPLDMLGGLLAGMIGCLSAQIIWQAMGHKLYQRLQSWYRVCFALPIRKGWVRD